MTIRVTGSGHTVRNLAGQMRAGQRGGGWFTVTVNQRAGSYLAALALRWSLPPAVLSLANLAIGVATALAVAACARLGHDVRAPAGWIGLLAWVGWQLAYSLDCADGQLARHTRSTSAAGARLDILCDLAVQISVLAAVVTVAAAAHPIPVGLAVAFAGTWLANLVTSVLSTTGLAASLTRAQSPVITVLKLARDYGAVITAVALVMAVLPAGLGYLILALTVINGSYLVASIAAAAASGPGLGGDEADRHWRSNSWLGHPAARAVLVAALPAGAIGWWFGARVGPVVGLGAAAAIVCAAILCATAITLPGLTGEGLVLGIGLPLAAMMTWTHLSRPALVWAIELAVGLVAAVWAGRSWRLWPAMVRLGSFWLAVPAWALGLVSALALGRATIAGQRLVYLGYAILVLALGYRAVRVRGRDPSIGAAAGLLLCHAALMVAGCRYLFVLDGGPHYTSPSAWGYAQGDRFWGGPLLVYHPNFIAMTAVLAASRLGPSGRLARWQRAVVLGETALLLVATRSRTGLAMAVVASLGYLLLVVGRAGLPATRPWRWLSTADGRRVAGGAVLPLALCLAVLVASGGLAQLARPRYPPAAATPGGTAVLPADQVLSGRPEVWAMVVRDFRGAARVEQAFGTADNSRGYLLRYPDRSDPRYAGQPKLTADNGPLGALRRGGLLGLAGFLLGAVLVLRRTMRRGLPAWIPITVLAALTSAVTEDEVAGTTPAWLMVALAELAVLYLIRAPAGDAATTSAYAASRVPVTASEVNVDR